MTATILEGDCREVLRTLDDESVHCAVTSPPYYAQRDYGVVGQIGLETSPSIFIAELVLVFEQVRRVLRSDGTLWLNMADSYNNRTRVRTSSHKPILAGDRKSWADSARDGEVRMTILRNGLKEKDLFGVPWQLALALRQAGWYLRQEIIWSKPVAKLDVASDRPATRHEQIFLFSKSKTYHFDQSALPPGFGGSVWTVPATGHEDHGASFPIELIAPCILAGCPPGGIVLDPFAGAGTTGVAALQVGRRSILIEMNPTYAAIAVRRTNDGPLFLEAAQ
jgi:DNA modification methylase